MATIEFYEKRGLYEQAGDLAAKEGDYRRARELYEKAIDDYSSRGLSTRAEGVSSKSNAIKNSMGSRTQWEDVDEVSKTTDDIDRMIEGFETHETKVQHVPEPKQDVWTLMASEPVEKKDPIDVDASSYKTALRSIGYTDEQLKPFESLLNVDVDKIGYSSKIAESMELKDDYLKTNFVFVSSEQKDLTVNKSGFSFMEGFANEAFRSCGPYIDTFSRDGPVYGSFSITPGTEINVTGKLSTVGKTKEKLDEIKRKVEGLSIKDLIDKDYVKLLVESVRDLRAVCGDIRKIGGMKDTFSVAMDSFSYETDGIEYYCFADRNPLAISFGTPLGIKGVTEIEGSNAGSVLEALASRGLIFYDEKKKSEFLLDEERSAFLRKGYHPDEVERIMGMKNKKEYYFAYRKEWAKVKDEMSKDWRLASENRMSELAPETRLKMVSIANKGRKSGMVEKIMSHYN